MKVYNYYSSVNPDDFIVLSAEDILKADIKVKSIGFNPMNFICANLVFGMSKNIMEDRVFSYPKTDSNGNKVIDEKGYVVYIRETKSVPGNQKESVLIETQKDLIEFISHIDTVYNMYDDVGIRITPNCTRYFQKSDLVKFLSSPATQVIL